MQKIDGDTLRKKGEDRKLLMWKMQGQKSPLFSP